MRKPTVGRPRTAAGAFSLSRSLPRLIRPLSALNVPTARPRPQIGRVPSLPGMGQSPQPAGRGEPLPAPPQAEVPSEVEGLACARCGHGDGLHPIRYVCDKYPHPDPLRICGCEAEERVDVCPACGHKARSHKPRQRCRACSCWSFESANV